VRFRLLACLAFAGVLAGCGGASAPGSSSGTGYVRFLHGSPDQTAIDFDLPANTVYVSDLQFKALTAYQPIPVGTYSVGATPHGSTTAINNASTNNDFVVGAGQRYTVILGGTRANSNQQLCIINETLFATASGSASAQFSNCSPTNYGTVGSVTIGYYPYTNGTAGTPVALGTLSLGVPSGVLALPASAANGVGFYAASPTTGSLLPVALDPNDTTNALPFVSDQNVSIFILDGPVGGSTLTMVGAIDPND